MVRIWPVTSLARKTRFLTQEAKFSQFQPIQPSKSVSIECRSTQSCSPVPSASRVTLMTSFGQWWWLPTEIGQLTWRKVSILDILTVSRFESGNFFGSSEQLFLARSQQYMLTQYWEHHSGSEKSNIWVVRKNSWHSNFLAWFWAKHKALGIRP